MNARGMRKALSGQVPVKLGPLALLLTVISICLTTLAILTFTTAEADLRLADRYADTVRARYELEIKGQEFLKDLADAARTGDTAGLAGYETEDKNVYEDRIEEGDASLTVRARIEGGDVSVLSYKIIHSWEEDTDLNVWNGFGW